MQSVVLLCTLFVVSGATAVVTESTSSIVDPKDDPRNPLKYITSNALTTIALAFYLPTTLALFYNIWRIGGKYMFCIAIGAVGYCAGLAFRYPLHSQPDSTDTFLIMYLLTILSPCFFVAGVYMLLGRLAMELRMGQYLLVKPEKLTKYFLSSDIGTFLFQAAGASMVTSTDQSRRNFGVKAFIIGMILQLASFCMFIALFVIWNHRVYKQEPSVWLRDKMTGRPWYQDWRTFSAAIFISCIMILIRSAFRVAEASEGGQGHLMTTESYFYCLDCFPLLISIIVYVPIWPGSFISGNPYSTSDEESYQMKARQPPKTY